MSGQWRFLGWLALLVGAVLGLLGVVALALSLELTAPQRAVIGQALQERAVLLVILAVLLPFLIGALLHWFLWAWPQPAERMAEEVALIHTVNPEHRVTLTGARAMRQLGDAVNGFAEAHARLRQQVQQRIDDAHVRLEEERNRLAALMSQLADSVLVCNREGRILLYNTHAARLLESEAAQGAGAPVGLGRSVFGLLERSQILHALDRVARLVEQQVAPPVARFVTARGDLLLRAQLAPVLDPQGEIGGFVLVLEDITRSVESDSRRERLLRQLTEGTRASLANIRAAVETMHQYPDMDLERRRRFTEVIRVESETMSRRLDAAVAAGAASPGTPWPLEDMLCSDLVHALQRSVERTLGLSAAARDNGEPLWLSVDSHALVQAVTHLVERLGTRLGVRSIVIDTVPAGRFARLAIAWSGPPLDPAALHEWEGEPCGPGAPTLEQVLGRHGAEIWTQADPGGGGARVCIELPTARPLAPPARGAGSIASRPVYYDFDLFNQPGQTPELDQRPLAELSYTVFDTETTGLDPSAGDDIISIGAVRIVNGRLLRQECFDRLILPRRAVRRESQRVHGITNEMLAGQPPLEQVLPMFQRFAEDTVLVAHNAAFDMRFLQLAQVRTGVQFIQPVLDTLMLSALVHPGHPEEEHRLERIAARLGVPVVGRHTALGDAIVAGEVFLRLLPLLAERGIRTLGQAREASQRTLYAKLEY